MKRYVNLMSEAARCGVTARRLLRRWALAAAGIMAALMPLAAWRFQERQRVERQHEALKASYDPVLRLSALNAQLRDEAAKLVREERLVLELSRRRPMTAVLERVSAAAAQSGGELYVRRLAVQQRAPGVGTPSVDHDAVTVEAAATLTYDIGLFVHSLNQAPVKSVIVLSETVATEGASDCKHYTLECRL